MIWEGDTRVGQFDVHYARDMIHATVVLEVNLSVRSEEQLRNQIDQDVVSSYEPNFERSNFLVTIFHGQEVRSYADPLSLGDDEED